MSPVDGLPVIRGWKNLICYVHEYSLAHKTLVLELIKGDFIKGERTFLHFSGVEYYSGPTTWRGIKITRAPEDECIELLKKIGADPSKAITSPTMGFTLFRIIGISNDIDILALGVTTSDESDGSAR